MICVQRHDFDAGVEIAALMRGRSDGGAYVRFTVPLVTAPRGASAIAPEAANAAERPLHERPYP